MSPKPTPVRWHCTLVALSLILGLLAPVSGAENGKLLRPIALGVLSDGDLVLLDRYGGLFRMQPDSRQLTRLRKDFGPWQVQDMTVVPSPEGDQIYVTARWPLNTARTLAALVQLDASGRSVHRWQANMPQLTGVAVEPESRTAYLTALQHGTVYSLDLSDPDATPTRVARIFQARYLGPSTIDTRRHTLYVTDPSRGVLYRISLDGSEVDTLAKDLGLVSAISLSPDGTTLYSLELGKGRITAIRDLDSDTPRVVGLTRVFKTEDPLALAVTREGTLWVGDANSHLLSEYGEDGEVRRALKLIGP